MVAVQFTGAVYFIRHMANAMEKGKGGSIITVSSLTAGLVPENYAAYAGAKAGINHVTRIAASEYGAQGIRFNVVSPTLIETPMTEAMTKNPELVERVTQQIPLQRLGRPEDIANTALFLASEESSFFTGQLLHPDGGLFTG